MIERFEKIWCRKAGADNEQLCRLNLWLKENNFPVCDLPNTYKELLKESNGGDFTTGNREYQLFSVEEIIQTYEAYKFSIYMPFAFPLAMDGCGNFYILNLRNKDDCIYAVSAGDLEWDECHKIADNFLHCLEQKETLDEILF